MRYDVKDLKLAGKGRLRIEWTNEYMQVLQLVRKHFKKEKPLKGLKVAACLHVTTFVADVVAELYPAPALVTPGCGLTGFRGFAPGSNQFARPVTNPRGENGVNVGRVIGDRLFDNSWRGCNGLGGAPRKQDYCYGERLESHVARIVNLKSDFQLRTQGTVSSKP